MSAMTACRQVLRGAHLGARPYAKKVMLLLTDGQVTERWRPNYLPVIRRLNQTEILRIGNEQRCRCLLFTARRCASAVYAVVVSPSVRPSVTSHSFTKRLNVESRKQRQTIDQGL